MLILFWYRFITIELTCSGAGAPAGNYMIQQQPGGQQRLLMLQPTQVMSGPPTPSTPTQPSAPVYGSPQRASPPGTTSDDSDDSVPSHHSQVPQIFQSHFFISFIFLQHHVLCILYKADTKLDFCVWIMLLCII